MSEIAICILVFLPSHFITIILLFFEQARIEFKNRLKTHDSLHCHVNLQDNGYLVIVCAKIRKDFLVLVEAV